MKYLDADIEKRILEDPETGRFAKMAIKLPRTIERVKDRMVNSLFIAGALFLSYHYALAQANKYVLRNGEYFRPSQLREVVLEECRGRALPCETIDVDIGDKENSYTSLSTSKIKIRIAPTQLCREVVRHELTHAENDPKPPKRIDANTILLHYAHYYFIGEPRAIYRSMK